MPKGNDRRTYSGDAAVELERLVETGMAPVFVYASHQLHSKAKLPRKQWRHSLVTDAHRAAGFGSTLALLIMISCQAVLTAFLFNSHFYVSWQLFEFSIVMLVPAFIALRLFMRFRRRMRYLESVGWTINHTDPQETAIRLTRAWPRRASVTVLETAVRRRGKRSKLEVCARSREVEGFWPALFNNSTDELILAKIYCDPQTHVAVAVQIDDQIFLLSSD